jgi:hypothetical protein
MYFKIAAMLALLCSTGCALGPDDQQGSELTPAQVQRVREKVVEDIMHRMMRVHAPKPAEELDA